MSERLLFLTQAGVVAAVAFVHITALQWHLYWYFPYLDLFVHFFAGLWVALAAAWLMMLTKREPRLISVVACALAIGIAWEIFEVAIGMTFARNYWLDTALDLMMDIIGGAAGFFCARKLRRDMLQ